MRTERVLPFTGVRVVSFAQLAQGPVSVQLLADLGAEVVKIERPGTGSLERSRTLRNGESLLFHMLHRNQKSITVNIKSTQGLSIVRQLVAKADVLVENFRPGVMDRLGLGYVAMSDLNEGLIYLSASGYGPSGPYATRPGQDLILQGLTGLAYATGKREDPPVPTGAVVIDFHSGALNAFAIAAALAHREKIGKGQHITTNLMEAAMHLQMENIFNCANGLRSQRSHSGIAEPGASAPYGIYSTADGYIVLSEASLNQLADAFADSRFLDYDAFENRDEVRRILQERLLERSSKDWISDLLSKGIWCGPVKDYQAFVEDEQVAHNRMFFDVANEALGLVKNLRCPFGMSEAPLDDQPKRAAPALGEHTREVLSELGYVPEQIDELFKAGAV